MAGPNRYSTLVAWAKVVLPLIALALLSTLFLFSRTPNPDDALSLADVDVEQLAREQRLSRPRFAGTLEDGRPVTLNAEDAIQKEGDPNLIQMSTVDAEMTLAEDERVFLQAQEGNFDLAAQVVDLAGSIQATTTEGYSLLSERVIVALETMHVTSPGAVSISGSGVWLDAGAMELTGGEEQALFSFTGGVRLLYVPPN